MSDAYKPLGQSDATSSPAAGPPEVPVVAAYLMLIHREVVAFERSVEVGVSTMAFAESSGTDSGHPSPVMERTPARALGLTYLAFARSGGCVTARRP